MHRRCLARILAFATLVMGSSAALGAEIVARKAVQLAPAAVPLYPEYLSSCRTAWKCGPYGCGWYNVCARRCPDRYSWSSLYGA